MNLRHVPNALSVFRLLLAIPMIWLVTSEAAVVWVAALCFLAYLTDIADGFIARRYAGTSDSGKIIDPLADKVFVIGFAAALLITGAIPVWFAVLVAARDIIIFSGGVYLKKRTGVLVQSNMAGKLAVSFIGLALIAFYAHGEIPAEVVTGMAAAAVVGIAVSLGVYAHRFFTLIHSS